MRITVVYLREYPAHTGEIIVRILKDRHYTLTGSMKPELTWELAVSNCDDYTITLLETAVSEFIIKGSYTLDISTVTKTESYTISRLRADSLGIDIV